MAFGNVKTEDLLSLVSNITEDSIIEALKYIDKNGIPPRREAYSSFIQYEGKEYPLKYVFEVTNNFILKNPKKIGPEGELRPNTQTIETVLRKLLPNPQSIKYIRKVESSHDSVIPLNQILYGPPGTGKTFSTKKLVENILKADKPAEISDFREFMTFHQSYSYEEFVEGIKPYEKENGDIGYKVEDGIFKIICAKAKANPKWNYVLVIDEINRGNIAKIFGELITLIEHDKRLGAKNGLEVTLPYSKTLFGVPKNLYIIGTMNTADKSLALLDVALRRRFDFIPMYPQYEIEGKTIHYSEFLKKLNKKIYEEKKQNADYLIGHSYFMDDEKTPKLKDILNKKVIPLLMEYFNNNKSTVKELLKSVKEDISFNNDEGIYHLEVK